MDKHLMMILFLLMIYLLLTMIEHYQNMLHLQTVGIIYKPDQHLRRRIHGQQGIDRWQQKK